MRIPGLITDVAHSIFNNVEDAIQKALQTPTPAPQGQIIAVPPVVAAKELPWMELVKKELGTTEIPGLQNNPRILWYFSFCTYHATYDSVSWCSAFANAMMITAGMGGTRSAAALDWINLNWGIELKYAVHGCLAIWDWENGHGHVSFVDEANDDGLYVIGGNQRDKDGKDKVCRKLFPWSLPPVSFKWPKKFPLPEDAEIETEE